MTARLTGVMTGGGQIGWSVAGAVVDPEPGDNAAQTHLSVEAVSPPSTPPPPPAPPAPPVPPAPLAGPGLTVAAQPSPGFVGGRVVVTYTVRNGSNALATGLRLKLGLPAPCRRPRCPPGCAAGVCALADLAPGATPVVRVVLAPNKAVGRHTGTLTTTGTDADPGDNVAEEPLRRPPAADRRRAAHRQTRDSSPPCGARTSRPVRR